MRPDGLLYSRYKFQRLKIMSNPIVQWAVSVFFLLWGLAYAGLVAFTVGVADEGHWNKLVNEGVIKVEYAEYIANIPAWVLGITVIAAITRLLAGIALILQKSWALPVYVVSLIFVCIIMYRGFFVADIVAVIRPSQVRLEIGFLFLSVAAVWFAYVQSANGFLN